MNSLTPSTIESQTPEIKESYVNIISSIWECLPTQVQHIIYLNLYRNIRGSALDASILTSVG